MGNCATKKKKAHSGDRQQGPRLSKKSSDLVQLMSADFSADYEEVSVLGEGSFGIVRLCKQRNTGLLRAVKEIPLVHLQDLKSVMNEIQVMKQLDHPNIVRVLEVYSSWKAFHIVMEYCEGGELFDQIAASTQLTQNQAAKYFRDMIVALGYLHSQSIVHRDIKPENLLLEKTQGKSRVKIADFGTAIYMQTDQKAVLSAGTSYYMAPEVIQGEYDWRCDIWSAGVVLYILLSGEAPFTGISDAQIYAKILNSSLRFDRVAWASVDQDAKALIRSMLSKDPALRPSAHEVLRNNWLCKFTSSQTPKKAVAKKAMRRFAAFHCQNQLLAGVLSFIVAQRLTQQLNDDLAEMFTQLDADGNGKLSTDEITNGFKKYAPAALPAEAALAEVDMDGDGFIDYTEFLVATANWKSAMNRKRLYQVFRRFDKNGDNKLSLAEMKDSLGASEHSILSVLTEADVNGDGEIDFDEFCKYVLSIVAAK